MLKRNDHLLFIGDSITHAHRRPEEHHDCYALGCGYVKMIAATLNADFASLRLRFSNRGECGHGTADLDRRWQSDCLDLQPDVVSILIGINDAHPAREARTTSAFCTRYQRLIDRTTAAMPGIRLVLIEPFGLHVSAAESPVPTIQPEQLEAVDEYGPAVQRLAERNGAAFVPMRAALRDAIRIADASHWMIDGVHPSAAGHLLIARQWLSVAIQSVRQHPSADADTDGRFRSPFSI